MQFASFFIIKLLNYDTDQKQLFRSVHRKRCSENTQPIYRRTPMPKCNFSVISIIRSVISVQGNFIEIAFRHGCSPVNLLHSFRKPFPKNTSGGLLLTDESASEFLELMYVHGFLPYVTG